MGLIGLSNVRAMGQTWSGKSSKEIKADAKKNFWAAGNNLFVNMWAAVAKKVNDKKNK